MSRSVLTAHDGLSVLAVDSFLFLGAGESVRADGRRDGGLDQAAEEADDHAADGLAAAEDAPVEDVPPAPGVQSGSAGGPAGASFGAGDITVLWPLFDGAAKPAGTPGGGGGNGGGGDEDDGGDGGGGSGGVLAEHRAGDHDGADGYDIWIEFKGTWTAELQQAFIQAADYFTGTATTDAVITDDIGGDGKYRGKTIDDLYVTAELKAIDGPGKVLGQAGPQAVWTANNLTAVGGMEFDIDDAQDYLSRGLWDDIVTHELMHVLGFGTLWEYGRDLVSDAAGYIGAAGLQAYRDVSGDQSLDFIPVETDGGAGTAGGHWDEAALGNELMTGFINDDGNPATDRDNVLSEFSVASLADLGYAVQYRDYPYDGDPLIT